MSIRLAAGMSPNEFVELYIDEFQKRPVVVFCKEPSEDYKKYLLVLSLDKNLVGEFQ